MTPIEGLYYALGEMAYAVARSDGKVQREEKAEFEEIVEKAVNQKDYGFEISEIIFKMLDKARTSVEEAYQSSLNMIRLNSHYLSPQLKNKFISVMEKIANAYPPVTKDEKNIIDRFKADFAPFKGDPVYYGSVLS
jgi:uncharacterized tellurite resistance protein B-like protein